MSLMAFSHASFLARRGTKFDIKESDDDESAVPLGTYELVYMGFVPTDSPGGPGVISACMESLKACHPHNALRNLSHSLC